MKVPVAAALRLFADRKSGIIYSAVFEELLIDVLHLDNKLLATVVFAVNVEHGAARIAPVAQLLRIQISDVAHDLFAMENGVQKADKKFFVKLRTKQALETKIGMRIDVSFFQREAITIGGTWQIYVIFSKLQRIWNIFFGARAKRISTRSAANDADSATAS